MRRGIFSGLSVVVVLGMLAGCADSGSSPAESEGATDAAVPTETVAETAPELTDEEALQIAVETYEEYLAIGGEVLESGGSAANKYDSITTANMAEANAATIELAETDDFTVEGEITVVRSELQGFVDQRIDAYVCLDLSNSQMYDGQGNPMGQDRTDLQEALNISVVKEDGAYKVDRSELWDQTSFCTDS